MSRIATVMDGAQSVTGHIRRTLQSTEVGSKKKCSNCLIVHKLTVVQMLYLLFLDVEVLPGGNSLEKRFLTVPHHVPNVIRTNTMHTCCYSNLLI